MVQRMVGITEEELLVITEIRLSIERLDRKRRKGAARISKQNELWDKAARTASKAIDPERDKRLNQLMLQRLSFRSFSREGVAESLSLTASQSQQISAAAHNHTTPTRPKIQGSRRNQLDQRRR
jgi:hypothetical protein